MGRVARLLALSVIALMTTAPAPSYAKKHKASAQKRAQREKKRAFSLFQKGKFEAGIEAMESAYRLVPHPGFVLNVAVAYDQWGGHCKDSLVAFDRFFEACQGTCKMLQPAKARHEQVSAACRGELAVITTPAGAAVDIDGKPAGTSPLSAPLGVGKHYVGVRMGGHEAQQFEVDIKESRSTRLDVLLKSTAPPPPPPPIDISPPPPPPPPADVITPVTPRDDGVDPWPWVAIGVGTVGVGVGLVFTLQTMGALDAEETARIDRRPKSQVTDLQDDATSKAVVANIGYAIGAVGIATGVVLLLVEDDGGGQLSVTAAPGGVGLAGTF